MEKSIIKYKISDVESCFYDTVLANKAHVTASFTYLEARTILDSTCPKNVKAYVIAKINNDIAYNAYIISLNNRNSAYIKYDEAMECA
jgi:hypothetical protein